MRFPFESAGMVQAPFPHAIYDGLWDDALLERIYAEFPTSGGREFDNPREKKREYSTPGKYARKLFDILSHPETLESLEKLTGVPNPTMELIGGGYHLIPVGGLLAMHTDFNRSPGTKLYRRLNCLIYLNKDWQDPGGLLQLGEHDPLLVAPEWNRTVIFETSDRSWHGHPVPTGRERRSVAAYFYSPEPSPEFTVEHDTVWLT